MSLGEFCKSCKSGSDEYKKVVCKKKVNDGTAECTKFDLEKVANDIPEIIGKDGGDKDRLTITKKNISSKDGKLY